VLLLFFCLAGGRREGEEEEEDEAKHTSPLPLFVAFKRSRGRELSKEEEEVVVMALLVA
jgi:hypothetical protein